jgi:hypothetical protein
LSHLPTTQKGVDFIIWISPNLTKHTYGWSQLEPNHKIEKLEIAVFILSIPRGI